MQWTRHKPGDIRVVTRFAWFPEYLDTDVVWLGLYTVREKCWGSYDRFWTTKKSWPGRPEDEPEDKAEKDD